MDDDFRTGGFATTVDHTTVTFAGTTESHVNKKTDEPKRHEDDVDGDGDTDLVFHFRTQETDLGCESTEAILSGETFGGEAIAGTDSVRIVRCNSPTLADASFRMAMNGLPLGSVSFDATADARSQPLPDQSAPIAEFDPIREIFVSDHERSVKLPHEFATRLPLNHSLVDERVLDLLAWNLLESEPIRTGAVLSSPLGKTG